MKKLLLKGSVWTSVFLIMTTKALGASDDFLQENDRYRGAVDQPFREAVTTFINYFLTFLGLIAVVMIVYAGVLLVTAQGQEEQINKGKKIILWAAIGILVIMLAYAFVQVIASAGDFVENNN